MCKDRFKELRDSQSVTSCCFVLGALCCRWGQVPPSSLDSHVRSYIFRLTSSDTRRKKINKWSSRGWKWKWEKQVAFSPRSTSCHSQWASSVYESTKHRIISKHECVIYNTALQPHHAPNKNTQSHVITAVSLMGGSWLSHTRCPQKPVYFFWSLPDIVLFFSCLCMCERSLNILWCCLHVFTPADKPATSSRVLWKGQCVMRDQAARCRIVLEAGWVTEDKSGLVAFEMACRPLH